MSILDSIQKSELVAEEMKRKATEEVNLLLENNKKAITKKVEELYAEAENRRKQIDTNTGIVIANKKKEIEERNKADNLTLEKLAKDRFKAVVDDIMKKVMQV